MQLWMCRAISRRKRRDSPTQKVKSRSANEERSGFCCVCSSCLYDPVGSQLDVIERLLFTLFAISLQLVVQRLQADIQQVSGAGFVVVGLDQGFED